MLNFAKLPRFTIQRDGRIDVLDLPSESRRIQGLANRLAETFPAATRIGLVYPSCPQLVLLWLAALKAGKEPCILQYPTEKMSVEYWRDSIRHTIGSCSLEGLVHGSSLASHAPADLAPSLVVDDATEEADCAEPFIESGAVIQLSSGTTGYKKGVRLTLAQLATHAELYNEVLRLGAGDTIVSWLPLYHDMGFIACFVVPLLRGVPVAMLDPITWVRAPGLLYDLIAAQGGTVCYMPNFAFEVMARQGRPANLGSMRLWVSCSEPTYVETLERFCAASGVSPAAVSTCYGMAENVFAVTQSQGLETIEHEGRRVVSCGRPIPGTEVKCVEGELYVRSPTSLAAYIGTPDVRDSEGYYATGDLGFIRDGQIVVSGRKRDVMVSAGRKYFLGDLDFALAKVFPQAAGRIAALADFNKTLGTETVTFLVELGRYWETAATPEITAAVREATGLETFEIHFVPPFFLTKTSSGKMNRRKTLEDWKACREAQGGFRREGAAVQARSGFRDEVARAFAGVPTSVPVGDAIDSLGAVVLRLMCEDHGLRFDPKLSIDQIALSAGEAQAEAREEEIFNVVALVDGIKLGFGTDSGGFVTPGFIAALEAEVGRKVRVEHFAVPPAPILLSDLTFHDYFMPRDAGPKYASFASVMRKIKSAGLILIDDEDSLRMLSFCVYPRLSYRFNHNPKADLLAHRLTAYTLNHHLLARDLVMGADIPYEIVTQSMNQLGRYLGAPVMKLAFHAEYAPLTAGWDYRQHRAYTSDEDYMRNPVDCGSIQSAVLDFVRARRDSLRFTPGVPSSRLVMDGPPHFCSFLINQKAVDFVLALYRSFCIAGLPSSVPYIEQRLKKIGKPYFYAGNLNPGRDDYECMLCTGFSGEVRGPKPYFEFMQVGPEGGRPRNVPPQVAKACPPLAECDPRVLEYYLANRSPLMPIGNMLLNGMRRLEHSQKKGG